LAVYLRGGRKKKVKIIDSNPINEKNIIVYVDKIRNKEHEHCYIFNNKSEVIFTKTSNNRNGIKFDIEELLQIQNSRLFIHNHPDGDSFSSTDIKFMLENDIDEFRIYGKQEKKNIQYQLKLIKPVPDEQIDVIVNIYKTIADIIREEDERNKKQNEYNIFQQVMKIFMTLSIGKEHFQYD
jgi:hypothetical protein